jgi:hypothetical protein
MPFSARRCLKAFRQPAGDLVEEGGDLLDLLGDQLVGRADADLAQQRRERLVGRRPRSTSASRPLAAAISGVIGWPTCCSTRALKRSNSLL